MPDPVSLLSRTHRDGAAMVVPDPPAGSRPEPARGGGQGVFSLVLRLDRPGPAEEPLAEVRRVLEGLLGAALPDRWDDVTAARRGTGREPLSPADRLQPGPGARRFPLFG